jgi:hypothetical protein
MPNPATHLAAVHKGLWSAHGCERRLVTGRKAFVRRRTDSEKVCLYTEILAMGRDAPSVSAAGVLLLLFGGGMTTAAITGGMMGRRSMGEIRWLSFRLCLPLYQASLKEARSARTAGSYGNVGHCGRIALCLQALANRQ